MYITEKKLQAIRAARDIISSAFGSAEQEFQDAYSEPLETLNKMELEAIKEITRRKTKRVFSMTKP